MMPPRKNGARIRLRPKTGAAHWEKYVIRMRDGDVAANRVFVYLRDRIFQNIDGEISGFNPSIFAWSQIKPNTIARFLPSPR